MRLVCQKSFCDKRRACEILGECVYQHEIFRDNPEASKELSMVNKFKHVVKIFIKHTKNKIVIGSYRGIAQVVNPASYQPQGRWFQKEEKKSIRKDAKKRYRDGVKNRFPATPFWISTPTDNK